MEALYIVLSSLLISSVIWIVPLLLLGRHKMIEDLSEAQAAQLASYEYLPDYADYEKFVEDEEVNTIDSYSICDEMISVAIINKIASRKVSAEFSFSIN